MSFFCLLSVVLVLQFDRTFGEYTCTLNSLDLTCSGFTEKIPERLTATINKTFIISLKVTNAKLFSISRDTFQNFTSNLQTVHVTSSGVATVESDAFSSNADLKILSLRDNELSKLDLEVPALQELDLSLNFLKNLSGFNVSAHPFLRVLNISYNKLTYLPKEILDKLELKNDFYVIIDNNPWDCLHPQWINSLSPKLMNAFCTDKGYNINYKKTYQSTTPRKHHSKPICDQTMICLKCSYTYCLVWLFGGIWAGIILGNVGKIRRMICGHVPMYSDKYTQCGDSLIFWEASGNHDENTR